MFHKKRTEAYDIISNLQDSGDINSLSLKEIKSKIINKPDSSQKLTNVFAFIDHIIEDLIRARKQGNAAVYKTLRNKLKTFVGNENLIFDQISYRFLHNLETAHFANGGELGGLSVFMGTLRATYNKAIKLGVATKKNYPFTDYKIRNKKPVHKALTEDECRILLDYKPEVGTPHY